MITAQMIQMNISPPETARLIPVGDLYAIDIIILQQHRGCVTSPPL